MSRIKRLQFDMGARAFKQLEKLRKRFRAKTYSDAFRKSLIFYRWLLDQEDAGYKVLLVKKRWIRKDKVMKVETIRKGAA